jgi:RNA polymerase sigma-70 factor (ECF subfamily)
MTANEFSSELLRLEPSLERFALSLTTDRNRAKDLVQETYLKALTYRDKFEAFTNLKAWTFTIMKNTFINNYRRSKRERNTLDTTGDLNHISFIHEMRGNSPESHYSTQEITRAIEELDDDFRIPFEMHNAGYKYKEIADYMGLKIGTVKSRIFFTRKKLMEALHDYE